ncbi:MAG TPA: phosphoribosylformylglycinamidine cyclo-ligase [Ktedonobacterales bacterium]
MGQPGSAYARAGVNLDDANDAKERMRQDVLATHGPAVLGGFGGFGGMYALSELAEPDPVLVSSIDGVGTKLKIAFALDRHESVGADLVNHCVNDILVCGARPLFFLDYIALGTMEPAKVAALVRGVARACRENGCALIGGETAAMPGMYASGEYDLAGSITGVVARERIVSGEGIRPDDVVIGLPSAGLHTNGYSLARAVFEHDDLAAPRPELGMSLGDALLAPHLSYLAAVRPMLDRALIAGMAHITGGGLTENLPRVLPDGVSVTLDARAWDVLPIFQLIQRQGRVTWTEMQRVFNLGIGYILICHPEHRDEALTLGEHAGARVIGVVGERAAGGPVVVEHLG